MINSKLNQSLGVAILATFTIFIVMCKSQKPSNNGENEMIEVQNAVKCILEHNYQHDEQKSWPPKLMIQPLLSMSRFNQSIAVLEKYESYCKAVIVDSLLLDSIPITQIPYDYELNNLNRFSNENLPNGDIIYFSPLLKSIKKDEYCMLCEIENYESKSIFLYLFEMKKNQEIELVKTVDGLIFHN